MLVLLSWVTCAILAFGTALICSNLATTTSCMNRLLNGSVANCAINTTHNSTQCISCKLVSDANMKSNLISKCHASDMSNAQTANEYSCSCVSSGSAIHALVYMCIVYMCICAELKSLSSNRIQCHDSTHTVLFDDRFGRTCIHVSCQLQNAGTYNQWRQPYCRVHMHVKRAHDVQVWTRWYAIHVWGRCEVCECMFEFVCVLQLSVSSMCNVWLTELRDWCQCIRHHTK